MNGIVLSAVGALRHDGCSAGLEVELMKRWSRLVLTMTLAGALVACATHEAQPPCDGRGMSGGMGPGMKPARGKGSVGMPAAGGMVGMMAPGAECALASGPLSTVAIDAAHEALGDEHRAEARYAGVILQLGDVLPFARIRVAEQRHIAAIEALLRAHDAEVPPTAAQPAAPSFALLADACRSGVESERANVALYDTLLRSDLPADERCVFADLRAASRDHHLPAFQRCGP